MGIQRSGTISSEPLSAIIMLDLIQGRLNVEGNRDVTVQGCIVNPSLLYM